MRLGAVGRKQVRCLAAEGIAVTARNKIDDFRAVEWAQTGLDGAVVASRPCQEADHRDKER